ncbi:vomeronasal type-1 receptor 1-like [Choloepus didactylus]|uniref:vomeronasal type-1 receptor 1-like n=1 Tax=Choloepus didactylus TaxID=27675 RepID=UPI0018A0B327|nr:vomeronasal type-1 receptor 1-like [Choloepus didactylus]
MLSKDKIFGIFFLSQTGFGILGNFLILMVSSYISLTRPSLRKPTDKILTQLTFANLATITSRGIPETMFSFGIEHFLNDVGCKAVMYIYSVGRGLSICTACLLSVIQAIIISPNKCRWSWLKFRVTNFIYPSFSFFWALNVIINYHVITESTATNNYTSSKYGFSMKYCTAPAINVNFVSCIFIRDIVFLFFMFLASVYKVILLCKHQKKLQEMHKSKHMQKLSPETRATQTVLCLVTCFVFFYLVNSFLIVHIVFSSQNDINLQGISVLSSLCYPVLCPFLLINIDSRISKALRILRKLSNTQFKSS